ncbi:MAG: TadE/TadG family type IV pilus assembly protein [Acidobacteriaceae bacterium]
MGTVNLKDESGQTMILTLLCMTILLGFVGFAVDIGIMFHTKRNMQIAADSAAIAAAQELNYGDAVAAGQAAAAQNGVVNGLNGATVTITPGPVYGPFAGNLNYVEAIVIQNQPTIFARLFNLTSMNVAARAVGTLGPSQGCVYTLATAGSGLVFNGMTVSAPTCVIVDDSASSPAGLAANAGVVTAQSIGVVGGYANSGATVTPAPVSGIAPVNDPLGYLTPPAFAPGSCVTDPAIAGTATLSQGCYNNLSIGGNGVVTLNGIYIVNGVLTITGTPTITGTGVTFYFPNSTASLVDGGTETWNISAPIPPAAYSGVLFYQDPSDTNALTFNNAANSTLEGIVYAPSANVTINADATTTLYESIDAASVTLNGAGTLQDYSLINNQSVLTAARLVE